MVFGSLKKIRLLFITRESHFNLLKETDDFSNRNSYENESRKLEYVRIIGDDCSKYIILDRYKHNYGIWLIGYDGRD